MIIEFRYLGMRYRTNADATRVERFIEATQTWKQTSGLGIRSQALTRIAEAKRDGTTKKDLIL